MRCFTEGVDKDWVRWHADYDDPTSSLARRLQVVRHEVRDALAHARPADGEVRLVSICAGDARDVLPELASHRGSPVRALLVERDVLLAERARAAAGDMGLSAVDVRTADAGVTDPYVDIAPADVVLACGVFGNVTLQDAKRTITELPSLLAADGIVIWTRGRRDDGADPSQRIRELFTDADFTEVAFTAPSDARFRVGLHRRGARSEGRATLRPGVRMFTFT